MRLSWLHKREDLKDTVIATIYSHFFPDRDASAAQASATWLVNPLTSLCYPARTNQPARQFMQRYSSYTPVPWKAAPKWLWGHIASTPWGAQIVGKPLHGMPVALHDLADLILIGNQRLRLFHFDRGTCTVLMKNGIPNQGMRAEIQLRSSSRTGPWLPLYCWNEDCTCFTEPVVWAFNLYHSPRRRNTQHIKQKAIESLMESFLPTRRTLVRAPYVLSLMEAIDDHIAVLQERYPFNRCQLQWIVQRMALLACAPGNLVVSMSHGDFTPGNVLTGLAGSEFYIVDWEFAGERYYLFDAILFILQPYSYRGLADRFQRLCLGRGMRKYKIEYKIARAAAGDLAVFWLEYINQMLEWHVLCHQKSEWEGMASFTREVLLVTAFLEEYHQVTGREAAEPPAGMYG